MSNTILAEKSESHTLLIPPVKEKRKIKILRKIQNEKVLIFFIIPIFYRLKYRFLFKLGLVRGRLLAFAINPRQSSCSTNAATNYAKCIVNETLGTIEVRRDHCQQFKQTFVCLETKRNPDYGYTSFDNFHMSFLTSFRLVALGLGSKGKKINRQILLKNGVKKPFSKNNDI